MATSKRRLARQVQHKPTDSPLPPDIARKLIGRPPSYRPEFANRALELAAEGYSLAGVAGDLGVARSTINDWQASYPEFAVACERAKAARAKSWESRAIKAVDEGISGGLTFIAFALKNCAPDDWREKIEVQSNHTFTLAGLIEQSLAVAADKARDVTPKPLTLDDNQEPLTESPNGR